jgi:hypothetical protein
MTARPCILILALAGVWPAVAGPITLRAVNRLDLARPAQTLELPAPMLAPLAAKSLQHIHVQDAAGQEVLCQAVDTDFDPLHRPDIVIFQADFAPGEARAFTASAGAKQVYTREQFKAHGRFVRERFDDFAWENDLIAHRMYGKALETWKGEPLTSSTVDLWSKRVPQMVIDEWYLVDNYHADTGQGADFYTAGPSRGCGGSGLWADGRLWTSGNFVESRVLANGPIRVLFELVYEPFAAGGAKVAEVKRITLDAGSQLGHFQSSYQPQGAPGPLTCAAGLKKVAGEQKVFNAEGGWLATWQKVEKNQGQQGLAVIAVPRTVAKEADDALNHLLLLKAAPDHTASYWAGFAWDKAGLIADQAAWLKYVGAFARGLASPIEVQVEKK